MEAAAENVNVTSIDLRYLRHQSMKGIGESTGIDPSTLFLHCWFYRGFILKRAANFEVLQREQEPHPDHLAWERLT